jgi:hypothetical protein
VTAARRTTSVRTPPAVVTEAAARRTYTIAAAPAAIVVAPGFVVAAHVADSAVVSRAADTHRTCRHGACRHREKRRAGDEYSLPGR